jgi:hypothetical protein
LRAVKFARPAFDVERGERGISVRIRTLRKQGGGTMAVKHCQKQERKRTESYSSKAQKLEESEC